MDNLEKQLQQILGKNGVFDLTKSETLRKELIQMWCDKNLKRMKLVYWIFFLLSLGMMGGGYINLRSAESTKEMILWAIFLMIGFNSTILMKLWYWVVSTKFNILREMKQLQLQIAELAGKEAPSEN
jgi:hypothetical protein